MIIEKVFPALRTKFPIDSKPYPVFIQQDNARSPTSHVPTDEIELSDALSLDGWSFRLANQPVYSSDLKVLDLGFFNSTQALQERTRIRDENLSVRQVLKFLLTSLTIFKMIYEPRRS